MPRRQRKKPWHGLPPAKPESPAAFARRWGLEWDASDPDWTPQPNTGAFKFFKGKKKRPRRPLLSGSKPDCSRRPVHYGQEELLSMPASRIARAFREAEAYKQRCIPAADQWREGAYLKLLRAAFKVQREAEQLFSE